MPAINYFLILFFGGLIGSAVIIGRKIFAFRLLSAEEKKEKLESLPPFFDFLHQYVERPAGRFINEQIHPFILKLGEKFIRRFRLVVLKAETGLKRLSDYFHGRRQALKNGNGNSLDKAQGKNSEFWQAMNEAKNGAEKNNSQEQDK